MASTPVFIQLQSGLSTPTLSLYADGSDTLVGGPDTLTEETNRMGLYQATVTEALSGIHYAKVLDGASLVGSGWVTLADDTSEYHVRDTHAAVGGLSQQQIADALKLAPTAGTPAPGSANADLDTLISRTAGGVTVSTSGTTNADGDFADPIVRGDAYNAAAGNAFTVSSTGFTAAVWDAVVTGTLKIKQRDTVTTTGTVTVTHDSNETITASIALTTAETEALVGNVSTTYEVELVVGSDQRTITGKWRVADSDES